MSRKARIEGAIVSAEKAIMTDLEGIVARFKVEWAADWEALRLCPLQHGLETMIEKLK